MARRKSTWALVSGVIVGSILLLDLATSTIDVIQPVVRIISGSPSPLVEIRKRVGEGQNECLEFGFERVPMDFTLGRIVFKIIESQGPAPISGDMMGFVFNMSVNRLLSLSIFSADAEEIDFDVGLQAKRDNDAAIVRFCPMLKMPGIQGELVVIPTFFSVAGQSIEDLQISVEDGTQLEDGIALQLIHPKNASVVVDAPVVERRQ